MLADRDLIFLCSLSMAGVRATITIKPRKKVIKISLTLYKNNRTNKNTVVKMTIEGEIAIMVFFRLNKLNIEVF